MGVFDGDHRMFGDMFDLDRDGELDCGERAVEFAFFEELNRTDFNEDEEDDDDDLFDDDEDDDDDFTLDVDDEDDDF